MYIEILDLSSSTGTIDPLFNEQIFSDSIWKNTKQPNSPVKPDTFQYYTKYENVKRQFNDNNNINKPENSQINQSKNIIRIPTGKNTVLKKEEQVTKDNKNFEEDNEQSYSDDNIPDTEEENAFINKINSIRVKSNKLNTSEEKINNNSISNMQNRQICMTEPDEVFYTHLPYFSDNLQQVQNNKTPQQHRKFTPSYMFLPTPLQVNLMNQFTGNTQHLNKGSFLSTQYSSNKMYMSNDLSDEICEDAEINEK